jgi:hypothetical protein
MAVADTMRSAPRSRRDVVLSAVVVLGVTGLLLLLTPLWSGLDTPDSEFYLSLSIFTDAVTDRAPVDSYFWTRLGYIAPVHVLTSLLGTWVGFAVWKAALLAAIVGSTFAVTRRHTTYTNAVWLTTAVSSSTVVLSYLGNSYITAPVMAGTALLIACATRPTRLTCIASGLTLGWLAMSYPGGALLGGTLWLTLLIHSWQAEHRDARTRIAHISLAAGSTVAALAVFLIAGAWLFPGLNWFGTYIEAANFDYGIYSSGQWVWLRDISLLVPASVLVVTVVNWAADRRDRAAQQAMIISLTSIGFILTYSPLFGAHFLEAPPSQAMLWPPAMIALALVGASRMRPHQPPSPLSIIIGGLGIVMIVAAGHVDPEITFAAGLVLAVVLIVIVVVTPRLTLATVITLSAFLAGSQLLQNSREPMGQFMLSPYAWAYRDNPVETKLRVAVNAQEWVTANTTAEDRIMQWVDGPWMQGDRELYTVASMQLWGPNLLTLEPTLDAVYGVPNLTTYRPTVIEMNGKSMDAVIRFWESLPADLTPTPPQCYDYAWPIDPRSDFPTAVGHTCLTRLTW